MEVITIPVRNQRNIAKKKKKKKKILKIYFFINLYICGYKSIYSQSNKMNNAIKKALKTQFVMLNTPATLNRLEIRNNWWLM